MAQVANHERQSKSNEVEGVTEKHRKLVTKAKIASRSPVGRNSKKVVVVCVDLTTNEEIHVHHH